MSLFFPGVQFNSQSEDAYTRDAQEIMWNENDEWNAQSNAFMLTIWKVQSKIEDLSLETRDFLDRTIRPLIQSSEADQAVIFHWTNKKAIAKVTETHESELTGCSRSTLNTISSQKLRPTQKGRTGCTGELAWTWISTFSWRRLTKFKFRMKL